MLIEIGLLYYFQDFRTKGTGLYDNLQEYNLPYAEAVFDISYFVSKPQPFYTLSKEIMPGKYAPTLTHHFIKFLDEKGMSHYMSHN